MAYKENALNGTYIQGSEPAPSDCRVSVFLILLSIILTCLLTIGIFHPGI